ncbi:hypothetical protein BGZ92_000545, partial [Podila epicladia]
MLIQGTYLALHRLNIEDTDHDAQPAGSLELVHEQPVFGTIKDIKSLAFRFGDEEDKSKGKAKDGDKRTVQSDVPRLGYLPKDASPTVLVVTSDSGLLSFVTFYGHKDGHIESGYFHILKEVEIAEPGLDYAQVGAQLAIDPSCQLIAVSALQNHIKLVVLRRTPRSHFDPVERISEIDINGTILGMEFLTPDSTDEDESAILAVLFHNKETSAYHMATFCINLKTILTGPMSIKVGTSQLGTNPLGSVLHIKALPNFPCSLVYIDEEKITLVTVENTSPLSAKGRTTHVHHTSLSLLKRELEGDDNIPGGSTYPLISACDTPPQSSFPTNAQALYLGSDTGELYRVNINNIPYTMNFEMVSGERPVGKVMQVIARQQFAALLQDRDDDDDDDDDMDPPEEIILNTDFLLYAGEQGDGGVLAIKEEETRIDLFAITHLQNCAPTLDFCMREPSMPGRDTLYVCTGMRSQGAIQKIRSGISVQSSDGLEDVSESCGLDLNVATLVAGRLRDGMLFQVHRSGVVVANPRTGTRYAMSSKQAIFTLGHWVKDSTLILAQNIGGISSLLLIEFKEPSGQIEDMASTEFEVLATKNLNAEPTTFHCWQEMHSGSDSISYYCSVGTLEPSVLVFHILGSTIYDVYSESLVSNDESPDQHVVAEFRLKSGEAVYSLTEWKIPRPGKSDAVYICVGTGQFSPTGSELSAAAPKTGRLVVLSIKQSKHSHVDMLSKNVDNPFRKLLISNGPMLKLLALDLEKKT